MIVNLSAFRVHSHKTYKVYVKQPNISNTMDVKRLERMRISAI